MASPPNYSATSPPAPGSLALPRQRLTLALPGAGSTAHRKLSTASASSSAHPLRQTSFPPPESRGAQDQLFSPDGSQDFSDSEITSAIDGTQGDGEAQGTGAGRKRKRGEKKARGRPPKNPSMVNGDDTRSKRGGTAGAASGVGQAGNDAEAEEEDDEDEEDATVGKQALEAIDEMFVKQNEDRNALGAVMPQWQQERQAAYKRVKLRTADVRKLVNQTLSQSVPANVVGVVSSYTKIFAGMLIESAREVQAEWMAVEEKMADGRENRVAKKLRREGREDGAGKENVSGKSTQQNGSNGEASSSGTLVTTNGHVNSDDTQADTEDGHEKMPNGHAEDEDEDDDDDDDAADASMGIRRDIEECDRGPILPDHLREALRRYKKSRHGGVVGFTGHSLEGREVAAPKMGGRRLFR